MRKSLANDPVVIALAIAGLYIVAKGGIGPAIQSLTSGLVGAGIDAGAGAVTGAVTGVSDAVGLPTPAQTTTDPRISRWIMDHPDGGQWAASAWSSVSAYVAAMNLPVGSGAPPTPGTGVFDRFPPSVDMGTGGAEW